MPHSWRSTAPQRAEATGARQAATLAPAGSARMLVKNLLFNIRRMRGRVWSKERRSVYPRDDVIHRSPFASATGTVHVDGDGPRSSIFGETGHASTAAGCEAFFAYRCPSRSNAAEDTHALGGRAVHDGDVLAIGARWSGEPAVSSEIRPPWCAPGPPTFHSGQTICCLGMFPLRRN